MIETVTTAAIDQYGRSLPVPARSERWTDQSGLASPAATNASGELTLAVPSGASRLRVRCADKSLRVGGFNADLSESTAGSYFEHASGETVTLYVLGMTEIKLRTSDGAASTVSFVFDMLKDEEA